MKIKDIRFSAFGTTRIRKPHWEEGKYFQILTPGSFKTEKDLPVFRIEEEFYNNDCDDWIVMNEEKIPDNPMCYFYIKKE